MNAAVTRKLTTILAADAERFSAAMEADEDGTYAALKAAQKVFFKLIEQRGGRVANTAGDGLIADFPSVVEAVRCALDVQQELGEAENSLRFRIGVHLGDVICDGADLIGEGVNLAARLQAMADPGGILISRQVYDQVKNKFNIGFDYLGERRAKNLPEEIEVFRITYGAEATARMDSLRPKVDVPRPRSKVSQVWEDDFDSASASAQTAADLPARVMDKRLPWVAGGVGVAVIMNIGSGGSFWPAWPVLVFGMLYGLRHGTEMVGRKTFKSVPIQIWVLSIFLLCINLMSQSGPWSLIPIGAMFGISLLARGSRRDKTAGNQTPDLRQ
ncbi:TOMM system kinase/cyclase fusion protein [Tritonibacter multivorans]|uniref:TOMM system kinase/cyclase fusion protein n=1 Tax=Tritonibacter multivorans TaxID=928856 RepID=A0A0P1GBN2_9RHOB|nr:adenylate/guanylate cyclase domain-containing protein [Tritonibacter multivorans]MDA7421409.1 adenylate/guanylate cyclase domain-containing protein [Tritonibacter multivorans]CUH78835.1 TOMM system kinase/cyclase fusion protein [Tritonibacter multivorans]SFD28850.1 Adenylate cyclase, class 3 [Tritonibacter multivorans]